MKYGIIVMGSRGDVQPFVALAIGLQKRGHSLCMIGPENFRDFVEGFQIPYRPISTDSQKSIQTPEILRLLKTGNILKFIRHIQQVMAKDAPRLNQEILEASLDCDFLLSSSLTALMACSIGEKYQKKIGLIFLSMLMSPTREFSHAALDSRNLYWLNKPSYCLNQLLWLSVKKSITEFRKALGLPYKNMMTHLLRSDVLTLYPVSKYLFATPKDWSPYTRITGFLSIPEQYHSEELPEGLVDWLGEGEKPIYIGFGSIPVPDPPRLISIMEEILQNTTHRIVFCSGWSVIPGIPTHKNLFVVAEINHDWLFPHCKAGVIHGGIGTTAALIRSKIPSVIVSVLADQPYHGRLIEKHRIGVHIPFQKLTTRRLLAGICKTQTREYLQNARELGDKINSEEGLEECLEWVDQYFLQK